MSLPSLMREGSIGVEYEQYLVSIGRIVGTLPWTQVCAQFNFTYEHAALLPAPTPLTLRRRFFILSGRHPQQQRLVQRDWLSLTQPLLKDFWIDIYRRDVS